MKITPEDEERLAAYLAGQEDFVSQGHDEQSPYHCQRCKRPMEANYTYCYRCHNFVKLKIQIAKGIA